MIIHNTYIARLIALFLSEKITEDELQELNSWRLESTDNETLFQRIVKEENIADYFQEYNHVNTVSGWTKFQAKQKVQKHIAWRKKLLTYASILILPISILSFYLFSNNNQENRSELVLYAEEIQPGQTKAILTPAYSNSVIKLTDSEPLNLKTDPELVEECIVREPSREALVNSEMNIIEVPRGGEYKFTLADGTVVFLNSMSKLTFPTEFNDGERKVILEGEAFFDVTASKSPFIVSTQGVDVTVLGTTFNISAYANEAYEATLLTGKIQLHTSSSRVSLKPLQKASIELGAKKIGVEDVDPLSLSEWHKGKIVFKNQSLEYIMKKLARWYDFDVIYENTNVKHLRFSCAVDKYEDITPFIKLLESTGRVKSNIENSRRIYLK